MEIPGHILEQLRPHQPPLVSHLLSIARRRESCTDWSDAGAGKCLGVGTPVLMFSGEIKPVEQVGVGDLLMGDDGTAREVLQLHSGDGPLFKIIPVKGDPWVCNENHILSLQCSSAHKKGRNRVRGETRDVPLKDYLGWSKTWQGSFKQYRRPVDWPEQPIPLPAYTYGCWIADGTRRLPSICKRPGPVSDRFVAEMVQMGFRIVETPVPKNNTSQWFFRYGSRGPLFTEVAEASQLPDGQRRILPEYLRNSRRVRLTLLAGILDCDGFYTQGGFEIITKSKQLCEDYLFLARSLGFAAYKSPKIARIKSLGFEGLYWRVFMSGDFAGMPFSKWKVPPRRQIKDVLRTGFSVEPIGSGPFFGFELSGNRRFLLGDFTVTHNTFVTAAVLAAIQEPTVVVVPKISVTSWHRAAAQFGDKLSVVGYESLRQGNQGYGTWTRCYQPEDPTSLLFYKCQCCLRKVNPFDPADTCYTNPAGVHCIETKKKPWNPGDFKWHPGVKRVVFDEAHRCGGFDSLNSEMLIACRRQGIPTITLSATMASSPLELKALGYTLGLHRLTDFPSFLRRNGVGVLPGLKGYRWVVGEQRQKEIMASLRSQIIPSRGIRISTEEIPNFPEVDIRADLFDLEEGDEIQRCYQEMAEALAELETRERNDKAPDHPLTRILRAQQRIELLKVPLAEELADSYREKGYSVGFFVNFSQTIAELRKRRKCDCYIDGTQTGKPEKRQRCIDDFQSNRAREIVVNSEAGGVSVSLHDLDGRFPRVGLAMPCYSARRMRQLLGRFPRDGGKSKAIYHVLLAAGTSDVQVHSALRKKLNNLDALNDADLCPDNLRVFASRLSRL